MDEPSPANYIQNELTNRNGSSSVHTKFDRSLILNNVPSHSPPTFLTTFKSSLPDEPHSPEPARFGKIVQCGAVGVWAASDQPTGCPEERAPDSSTRIDSDRGPSYFHAAIFQREGYWDLLSFAVQVDLTKSRRLVLSNPATRVCIMHFQ